MYLQHNICQEGACYDNGAFTFYTRERNRKFYVSTFIYIFFKFKYNILLYNIYMHLNFITLVSSLVRQVVITL